MGFLPAQRQRQRQRQRVDNVAEHGLSGICRGFGARALVTKSEQQHHHHHYSLLTQLTYRSRTQVARIAYVLE